MKYINLFFIVICSFPSAFGQFSLEGKVTDKNNTPLIGATVLLNEKGEITDSEGYFVFKNLPSESYLLSVNYIGYKPYHKLINIKNDTLLDIQLDETSTLLDMVVVSGSKYAKKVEDEVVSIEVIDQKTLSAQNTVAINEALQRGTSVNIIDGQANIRGGAGFSYGAGSRVLILLDDLPMLQADAGTVNWTDLPIEAVKSIEVLKGAASSLYGSSALNGVINLQTLYPTSTPKTQISTSTEFYLPPKQSSYKWWSKPRHKSQVSLLHSHKIGRFSFLASANYYAVDSYQKNTFHNQGRFYLKTNYKINNALQVGVNINYNKADKGNYYYWQGIDSLFVGAPSTINANKHERITIDPYISYQQNKYLRHKLSTRIYNVINNNSGSNSNRSRWYYGEYNLQYLRDSSRIKYTVGIVGQMNDIVAELYQGSNYKLYNGALFAQADINISDQLNSTVGVRYEYNKLDTPFPKDSVALQEESKPVFRAGLNYHPLPFTWLRASFGQGYRFPSLAEKFIETSLGSIPIVANFDLTSESGYSVELGIRQGFKIQNTQGILDLALFQNDYNNMIEFQINRTLPFHFSAKNIGDIRIRGFESNIMVSNKKALLKPQLRLNYTYLLPRYKDFSELISQESTSDDNILKYRNKHVLKVWLNLSYKKWSTNITYSYRSQMEAVDIIFDVLIPGVHEFRENHTTGTHLVNLDLNYSFSKFKINVFVNNLTNTLYAERPGIIGAPRSIGAKVNFAY